jgi:hypothetical protein
MSGKPPIDALARANSKLEGTKDILEPAVELGKGKFSQEFLEAIDKALCFAPEERPQSIAAWKAILPEWEDSATGAAPGGAGGWSPRPGRIDQDAPTQVSPDTAPEKSFTDEGTLIVGSPSSAPAQSAPPKPSSKSTLAILVAVVAVVGIGIGVWQMQSKAPAVPATPSESNASSAVATVTTQMAAQAKPSIGAITELMAGIPCSVLQASVNDRSLVLRGFAAGTKTMEQIEESLGKIAGISETKNEIHRLPQVYCQTVELYAPYWRANRDSGFGTAIGTPKSDNAFVAGERLVLDIGTPTYHSSLYVDYFDHEGNVVHMMPSPGEEYNQGDPRESIQLGEAGDIGLWEVAPPFGTDMVVLLATSVPLFEGARGQFEDADSYRAAVRKRLKSLDSSQTKISADFVVITTRQAP